MYKCCLKYFLILGFIGLTTDLWAAEEKEIGINELFSLAERQNLHLRTSQSEVKSARFSIEASKEARLPSLEVSISGSYIANGVMLDRNMRKPISVSMPHWGNNFILKAVQVIYSGGRLSRDIEMKELSAQMAELGLSRQTNEIRYLLTAWYVQLLLAYNRMEVFQHNLERTERLIALMTERYRQGTVLRTDITRYELQKQELHQQLLTTENNITLLSEQIAVAVGFSRSVVLRPKPLPEDSVIDVSGWQHELERSPLLQLRHNEVLLKSKAVELVKAERNPQLTLVAANQFDGPILIEIPTINKNFNYWYVGLGLSLKLDAFYKTRSRLKEARQAVRVAREEYEATREDETTKLNQAVVRWREARTDIQTQSKRVELARQNFSVVSNRYKNGLCLITDLIDASNIQLTSELDLVNAKANAMFNYYGIKHILGNL